MNPPGLALQQRALAMAVDPAGEVYIATTTAGAVPFPTTPGAFQSTPPSSPYGSGVVAKLNASGSALLYATYLSGNGLSSPRPVRGISLKRPVATTEKQQDYCGDSSR